MATGPSSGGEGSDLARTFATAPADAQTSLIVRLRKLSGSEKLAFVAAVRDSRSDPERWMRAAPALAALAIDEAADELAAVGLLRGEETQAMSQAALAALATMPPELSTRRLVDGLTTGDRRQRTHYLEALRTSLETGVGLTDFVLVVTSLRDARRGGEASTTEQALSDDELDLLFAQLVSDALVNTQSPEALLSAIGSGAPPPLVAGLARGMTLRPLETESAFGVQEGAEADASAPVRTHAALSLQETFAATLLDLAACDDPIALAAVYSSLPSLVDAPTAGWVERLIPHVQHDDARVSFAAWAALKALSGEDHAQISAVWQAWWARHEAGGGR